MGRLWRTIQRGGLQHQPGPPPCAITDGPAKRYSPPRSSAQASANCHDALSLIQNPNNVPPPTADPFIVAPEYNTCDPTLVGAVAI